MVVTAMSSIFITFQDMQMIQLTYADLAVVLQLALQLWATGSCTLLKGLEAAAIPLNEVIAVQHFTQVCQAHIRTLQEHKSCPE